MIIDVEEYAYLAPCGINEEEADRIIAATSLVEDALLVTADKNLIKAKIISTIW